MVRAARPPWQNAIITLSAVVTTAVVLGVLYVGRIVLVPIAMAIFFTYVLAPVVTYLQRYHMGRKTAVIITVSAAILLFLGTSFLMTQQLASLTAMVADNADSIKEKIGHLRNSVVGTTDSPLSKLMDDIENMLAPNKGASTQVVVLEPRQSSWTPSMTAIIGPVTEAFGQAAFSFILVIFMLLSKSDLADRVLRLVGERQLTRSTRAMTEASRRVSRFLFFQFVLNFSFGLLVAIVMLALGLKYSLLWGFLIAIMRYVPFIGVWIGVIPPVLFAIATGADWALPAAIAGIVLGLEFILSNFAEPFIFGQSLGLSEVALLVSAAFWSFLWGPVGLILSGPITTCLLVLGRHAPPFRFLEILLGSQPALSPAQMLFQRLTAKDQDEALRTMHTALKSGNAVTAFDEMLLPALSQVKASRLEGDLSPDDDADVTAITREMLDDILEETREPTIAVDASNAPLRLLACPAQDEFDRFGLDALVSRLPAALWNVRVTSVTTLTSELLDEVAAFDPRVIVIGSLPPGGVAHARYLIKRLRTRFPQARLLLGRWHDLESNIQEWTDAGADHVSPTLDDTLRNLASWKPVLQGVEASHNGIAG